MAHPGPVLPSTFEEGTPARDGARSACGGLLGLLGQAHGARHPCRAHRRPQLHQGQVIVEGPRVKLGRGWRRRVNEAWAGGAVPKSEGLGLPSHLRVGHDAIHLNLLRRFPLGPLCQRYRPQKLVRGPAARDTQDRNARSFPLETLPPPTGTPQPPASQRPRTVRRREDSEAGKETAARGQQRPGLARGAPPPTTREELEPRAGDPGGRGPDVPREAVRRRKHPGRGHQDAAAQRLPAELQPHQPGPGPRWCCVAPHNAAVRPRHVDSARAPLATRPWKGRRGTSKEAQVPVVLTIETPLGPTLRSALLPSPLSPKPLQAHLAQVNPSGGGLEAWDAQVLLRNTPLSLTAPLPLFSTPGSA